MSDARVPYRCARAHRCVNRVRVDHNPQCACRCHGQSTLDAVCDIEGGCGSVQDTPAMQGGAIVMAAGLCLACTTHVTRALEELPLDYTELDFLLASGESGITSDIVMGSKELRVPIRVSIEALQASMVHETQIWAEPVAERMGITWDTENSRHCRPGFVLQRASSLLAGSLTVLLNLPEQEYRYAMDCDWVTRDGIAGALELLRMHDLVRFASGKTKLVHELPTPCPRCEHMALARHNGTDHVVCENCGVRWEEKDYQRLTLILAEDYRDVEVHHDRVSVASLAEGTVRGRVHDIVWSEIPRIEVA